MHVKNCTDSAVTQIKFRQMICLKTMPTFMLLPDFNRNWKDPHLGGINKAPLKRC